MIYAGGLYILGLLFIVNSLFQIWRFKDLKGFLIGTFLINYGVAAIYAGMVLSEKIVDYPWAVGWENLLSELVLANAVITVKSFWNKDFQWKKWYWGYFLFPFIHVFTVLSYHLSPRKEQVAILQDFLDQKRAVVDLFEVSSFIHMGVVIGVVGYIVWGTYTKFRWKDVVKKYQRHVFLGGVVVAVFVLFGAMHWYKHLFVPVATWEEKGFDYTIYFFTAFLFFQFFQFWPYYFKQGPVYFDTKTFTIEKYFNTYLKQTDTEKVTARLKQLQNEENIFTHEDLTLPKLAGKVGITTHQLSTYVNQHLHQSYSDFINSKRVELALDILAKDPEKNILGICYDAGFNSPSAFYKAFKKNTGYTPTQWKAKQGKS